MIKKILLIAGVVLTSTSCKQYTCLYCPPGGTVSDTKIVSAQTREEAYTKCLAESCASVSN